MYKLTRPARNLAVIPIVVAALGVGIAGGAAAVGVVPALLAPDGVRPAAGIASTPQPAPHYKTNAAGQTYGSALDAISPETEPDLIMAVATNGMVGYVRKGDLDIANGNVAAKRFSSPEDAVTWQETAGAHDRTIPVYAADGTGVVGTFVVVGSETQAVMAAADPFGE